MNELRRGVFYRREGSHWCTGCGCNPSSRHCAHVDENTIVFPLRSARAQLAGVEHTLQVGALNALASPAAAQQAVAQQLARRPSAHELRSLALARAY
ncbi:MAG: hypothetical protein RML84_09285 [Anaerolineae bacterium]|nr:hypothetical protein [Anaerolineae bacterium]